VTGSTAARIDWASTFLPDWITDRVSRLGYPFPTEVQRRAAPILNSGLDAVIISKTGSGKTFSFLAPMLAQLSYPPQTFPDDLKGPQALVVVPTLELGVQCALLVYKLLGGNLSQGRPGDAANMFTYTGPRGIKVRGLLNKEEVAMARGTDYLRGVHVVVATPAAVMELYAGEERQPILDHLRVLVVDEYDECVRSATLAMSMLLSAAVNNNAGGERPQVVLVGATVTGAQVDTAVAAGWVREPVLLRVGAKDGEAAMPTALSHRYVVCEESRRLALLARLLRRDLEALGDDPEQPARAMVFAQTPEDAAGATEPLRSALWGDHKMAVLLPPGTRIPPPPGAEAALGPEARLAQDEEEARAAANHELAGSSPFSASDPIRALHSFRDNRTSLLLCTPYASRGLDLPAVSHVYNLGLPQDATQYLHRAGRAGRIGSTTGGIVTTLVTEAELADLRAIAAELSLTLAEDAPPPPVLLADAAQLLAAEQGGAEGEGEDGAKAGDSAKQPPAPLPSKEVEKLRRGLEDLYNLM